MMEEARVIALVRSGNAEAFTGIVTSYHEPIRRYLYHLTGDYETAEDLTQDTFLQAYQNILKSENNLSLKAWLYRIATNNAWKHSRRKSLFTLFGSNRREKGNTDTGNQGISDDSIVIQEALLKVPEEQRTCLVLHFVEGFKYREIAETMGISEDAVRKRVERGSDEFRKVYKE